MSTVTMYLKIKLAKGGLVKGTATAQGHTDEVLIDTIRWGAENSGLAATKGGKVNVRHFEFTKKMCPGSVPLLLACHSCDSVAEAIISFRSANATEKVDFLKWTLTDGFVRSYEVEAAVKDSIVPSERVCISFRTLVVEYTPRTPEGMQVGAALTARLDLAANTFTS